MAAAMTAEVQYLDLAMFTCIAAEILQADVQPVSNAIRTSAASSALGAASANYFGRELYPDVVVKIAITGYKLVRNHPLPDGNKRAAYVSMVVMAQLNNFEWHVSNEDEAVAIMFAAAAGTVDEVAFADWVRRQLRYREASPNALQRLYAKIAEPYAELYCDDMSDSWLVEKLLATCASNARVLDIGCGPGTFTPAIMNVGAEYIGIDFSSRMLDIARHRISNATFHQMDMRSLDFEDNTFDAVIAAYSLIHIPDVELPDTLKEISRVMKPGGHLLVIGQIGLRDHLEDDPLAPGERVFVNFFTADRLRAHVEFADLRVVELGSKASEDPQSMSEGIVWVLSRKTA